MESRVTKIEFAQQLLLARLKSDRLQSLQWEAEYVATLTDALWAEALKRNWVSAGVRTTCS